MSTTFADSGRSVLFVLLSTFLTAYCASVTAQVPIPGPGESGYGSPTTTVSSPDWFINLTEAGYSDIAADVQGGGNSPLYFREYLSGEWGAALNYTGSSGSVWFEPKFVFPDWLTNSDFVGTTPPAVPPLPDLGALQWQDLDNNSVPDTNSDGNFIFHSFIQNAHFAVRQTYEFLDTVGGIAQGDSPASAGGPGMSITSNRYVLKQTYEITNITPEPIGDVQLYQFLHGLHSTRAVFDNRDYGEPTSCGGAACSDYHHDITQRGETRAFVDTNADFQSPDRALTIDLLFDESQGQNDAFFQSLLGMTESEIQAILEPLLPLTLPRAPEDIYRIIAAAEVYVVNEDVIAFHSDDAPAAWEVGRYGVEGVDSHRVGKPPEPGVHWSVESGILDNLDLFDSGDRWVSGAQMFELGTLNPDAPVTFDVLLSIGTSESATFVPIPASLPLLGSAIAGLIALRRRVS